MDAPRRLPLVAECALSLACEEANLFYRSNVSLTTFMNEMVPSSYTTIVTIDNGSNIPLISFHVNRLLNGLLKLNPNVNIPSYSSTLQHILFIVDELSDFRLKSEGELQMVVVLKQRGCDESSIVAHVSNVDSFDATQSGITVECRGRPRQNPSVKNTIWFRERKALLSARSKEAHETILVGHDDKGFLALHEGLVSNIFVITVDLQVYTAPDTIVLSGSVRHLVLLACEELCIPVFQEAPRLEDFKKFTVGFLSNARKWVLPVSRLLVPLKEWQKRGIPECIDFVGGTRSLELVSCIRDVVYKLARDKSYSTRERSSQSKGI